VRGEYKLEIFGNMVLRRMTGFKEGEVQVSNLVYFMISPGHLEQWYSTGGTRTPGGTRRHLRGYVKFKISIYILFHE
jgi:hypothetical protein